ncbi:MAG: DUF6798 domain-containing protein, partial [Sulfurovum sp.]
VPLIKQLTPLIIPLTLLLPLILKTSTSPNAEAAQLLFLKIRSPHHYDPLYFRKEYIPFIGWLLIAVPFLWQHVPFDYRKKHAISFMLSVFTIICFATLCTTVVFIPAVAQLYVWRLAPYLMLFAQMTLCAAAVKLILNPEEMKKLSKIGGIIVLSGVLLLNRYTFYYLENQWYSAMLLGVVVIIFILRRYDLLNRFDRFTRKKRFVTSCVIIFILCLSFPLKYALDHSNLIHGFPEEEASLYTWARKTPSDAVFLIPLNMRNFRLNARRAIIVDWKSTPLVPDELMEWYHRIQIVSGIDNVTNEIQALKGYSQIDEKRLDEIKKVYPFDYAVFKKDQMQFVPSKNKIAYESSSFVVIDVCEKNFLKN